MGQRTISTRIVLEGDDEYRSKLSGIDSELKTLSSNMKLVDSDFRGQANTTAALTAKHKALQDVYVAQKEKVATLSQALQNAKTQQAAYSSSVESAKSKIAATEAALEKLKGSTGDTSDEEKKLTTQLTELKSELAKAERGETAAGKAANDYQQKLNNAQIGLNDLDDELRKNEKYMNEAAASSDGCAKSIDKMGNATKDAGEESEQFGKKSSEAIDALASALMAAGVTAGFNKIRDAINECVDAYSGFETAMAKVSTIADTSKMSLSDIQSAIETLSSETGQSAADLGESVYQAISGGVDTASAVQFVEQANELAVGGFTDTASAVDVLTTALNAYGLKASDAKSVSDMLVTTQNLGKTTVSQLAQSIGQVIPTAAAYNVQLDNLSTAMAILTQNGLSTNIATTALNSLLSELGNSSSKAAQALTKETGESFSQLMAEGNSLGDVLEMVYKSVGESSDAFSALWGETARRGANSLLGTLDKYSSTLSSMQNSAGATSKAFKTMENTTAFADQKFKNAVNNFKIAIGDQLAPGLAKLKSTGAKAFEWATDFIKKNPWLVSSISALVSALGVLSAVLAGFTVYQAIVPKVTAAVKALNVALEANPAALVAVGIATLVAAMTSLAAAQDDATTAVHDHLKALKESENEYKNTADSYSQETADTVALAESLSTLSEKEAKSASDKALMVKYVDELNEKIPDLNLSYDEQTDTLNRNAAAIIALARAQASKKEQDAKVDRLSDLYVEQKENADMLSDAQARLAETGSAYNEEQSKFFELDPFAYQNAQDAFFTAQSDVEDLTTAGEDLQSQIDAIESSVNQASMDAGDRTTQSVDGIMTSLDGLMAKYEETRTAAQASLDSTISGWTVMDNTAVTSAADAEAALQSQITWLTNYDENLKALEGRQIPGVDMSPLIQSLSDGSTESAALLAGMATASDEEIKKIAQSWSRVSTLKQNVSGTMAEAKTNFGQNLDDMMAKLNDTVNGMDNGSDLYKKAMDSFQKYADGIKAKEGVCDAAAQKVASSMQAILNNVHINVPSVTTATGSSSKNNGGHFSKFANGTDFSPDMFIAGENGPELVMGRNGSKIWTAQQTAQLLSRADQLSRGQVAGGTSTVVHTGVIRVEGVNDHGDFVEAYDYVVDQLRRENRL